VSWTQKYRFPPVSIDAAIEIEFDAVVPMMLQVEALQRFPVS